MAEPLSPEQVAKEIALALSETCVHEPGPPKVDCPECCEQVLTTALHTATAQAERRGRQAGLIEAADISAKLYGLFGKKHPKREVGELLAQEFRRRAVQKETHHA